MLTSLKNLYRFGPGPSSSHTIGPYNAAKMFLNELEGISYNHVRVSLFGSLALTGRGHLTDYIIKKVFSTDVEFIFDIKTKTAHPNTLLFEAYSGDKRIKSDTFISIGGGAIIKEGDALLQEEEIYPFSSFTSLIDYLKENNLDFLTLARRFEGEDIEEYIDKVLDQFIKVVKSGLVTEGEVGGKLHLKRIAKKLFLEATTEESLEDKKDLLIASYAYAVAEENAAGSILVTAPTCGAAGVLPALVYYSLVDLKIPREKIIEGIIAAGMIGLVIKHNATISGAVGGCQAEIGSATAMGAGFLVISRGLSLEHFEYAAEAGLEHQLGLTCDPVMGYVAIPCIERNGIAALKAYDAYLFAKHLLLHRKNKISFDEVVSVMKETGEDLATKYKETSIGGLAKAHKLR